MNKFKLFITLSLIAGIFVAASPVFGQQRNVSGATQSFVAQISEILKQIAVILNDIQVSADTVEVAPVTTVTSPSSIIKPASQQQVTSISVSPAPISPTLQCSTPKFIYNSNPPPDMLQYLPDIKGRFVVWQQSEILGSVQKIKGIDLGSDMKFGTRDDGPVITLIDNQTGPNPGSFLGYGPRVNKNGIVVFIIAIPTATGGEERVVTCQFSSCSNTMNVIDKISFIPFLSTGNMQLPDINDNNQVVYIKRSSTSGHEAKLHDLTTNNNSVLLSMQYRLIFFLDGFYDIHIDDSGVIAINKIVGGILGPITRDLYEVDSQNNLIPFLVDSQTQNNLSLVVGAPFSTRAYNQGGSSYFFYLNNESSGSNYDVAYRITAGASRIAPPTYLSGYTNNQRDEILPRFTFNASIQKPFLSFVAFVKNANNDTASYIQTMVLDSSPSKGFIPYKIVSPPSGNIGFQTQEMDNFNIVAATSGNRVVISECN